MNGAQRYNSDMSVESWVKMFEDIYFATKNHERTDTQIICRLLENVGNMGKFVLKEPVVDGIGRHLAKTFAWYCALAIRLGRTKIDDYVWHKFPYACAYCGEIPCKCGKVKKPSDPARMDVLRKANSSRRPRNLREYQAMFGHIYVTRNLNSLSANAFEGVQAALPFSEPTMTTNLQVALAAAFGRLVEELGELTASIRLRYFDPAHVEDEMADIFSWLIGISNLINSSDITNGTFFLSDYAWQVYPGHCRFCGMHRCKCTSEAVEDVVSVAGILTSRHLDTLTGLGNRDAWNELRALSETKTASINKSLPLCLIMLDLDGFKAVNDTSGHQQGDAVLTEVANLIRSTAVPPGQAFRLGGDEFCIILSNYDFEPAQRLARRLCEVIKEHRFTNITGGEPIRVGASLGVVAHTNHIVAEAGDTNDLFTQLYSNADKKLYEAKQKGKGKVC